VAAWRSLNATSRNFVKGDENQIVASARRLASAFGSSVVYSASCRAPNMTRKRQPGARQHSAIKNIFAICWNKLTLASLTSMPAQHCALACDDGARASSRHFIVP
jgi:hypothetical protein